MNKLTKFSNFIENKFNINNCEKIASEQCARRYQICRKGIQTQMNLDTKELHNTEKDAHTNATFTNIYTMVDSDRYK